MAINASLSCQLECERLALLFQLILLYGVEEEKNKTIITSLMISS